MIRIFGVSLISTIGVGVSFYFLEGLLESDGVWSFGQSLMIGLGLTLFLCLLPYALADGIRILLRLPIWTIPFFSGLLYLLLVLGVFLFMPAWSSGFRQFTDIFEPFLSLWGFSLFYGISYVVSLCIWKPKEA